MFAIARYSASVDDLETLLCFLDFHEISEFPRKMQYPVTDRLVVRQPPQSESQKAFKMRLLVEESSKPCPGVPFIYQRILMASSQ